MKLDDLNIGDVYKFKHGKLDSAFKYKCKSFNLKDKTVVFEILGLNEKSILTYDFITANFKLDPSKLFDKQMKELLK